MLIDDNLETVNTAKAMGFRTLWIHLDKDEDGDDDDGEKDDDIPVAKRVQELPSVCPELFQ
jgi:FMN phosphatase YigB (HAD superfamily)